MAGRIIKIKLTYRRLIALEQLHRDFMAVFLPKINDRYGMLLSAHLRDFHNQISLLLSKEQKKYTLCLNEVQTMAFCQVWELAEIKGDEFKLLALQDVLNEIDKYRVNQNNKQPHDKPLKAIAGAAH